MKITITRGESTPEGTPGVLVTENGFTCDTLELMWADNKKGISCIKLDTYSAEVWDSPTLNQRVLRLEDKHGRSDCLIHNGNFAGSIAGGEFTNVHGCTLVGYGYGTLQNPLGKSQFAILRSVKALQDFMQAVGDGPHEVTYV